MPSPIFQLAARAIRREAAGSFRRSTFGRMMREVDQARRSGDRGPARLRDVVKRYGKRFDPKRIVNEAMGSDLRQLVREVEVYSRRGGASKRLVEEFLDALGPAGNLIRAVVGPGKGGRPSSRLSKDLEAATRLLEAYGHVVIPPGGDAAKALQRAMGATGKKTVGATARGVAGLINYLETQGYKVTREEEVRGEQARKAEGKEASRLPFGIPETTSPGRPRRFVDLPGPGKKTRLPRNHPVVTGDFVKVDSANVHSWAYDAEKAYLYIRFLASAPHGQPRTKLGSLYRYRDITPEMAKALHSASSKGSWIWDNLRIRGTVAGYQKPYALVGVMDGYVPRQATLVEGGMEAFKKRQLHVGGGRWLTSSLPDELVGRAGGPSSLPGYLRGEPNRGRPNRGGPNRGEPNRG